MPCPNRLPDAGTRACAALSLFFLLCAEVLGQTPPGDGDASWLSS